MSSALSIPFATSTSPPAPRGAQYIDLKTAAERSGQSERTLLRRCPKWAARGLARQEWQAAGGKPKWFVREDADGGFSRVRFPDELPADLKNLTDQQRRSVLLKRAILRAWEAFAAEPSCRGLSRDELDAHFLELLGGGRVGIQLPAGMTLPGARTLRNWREGFRDQGLEGLIDGRSTRQQKPIANDPFFEFFRQLYLDLREPSLRMCWEISRREAERCGWMQRSYPQTKRYEKTIPPAVKIRFRKGSKAFDDIAAAHVERDYSKLRSNEVWCSDHHRFDAWITHNGRKYRPWLTAFQDMRSRKIVGWIISANSGNTDTILAAMTKGIDSHGVPESVYWDNGADYSGRALNGTTKRERQTNLEIDSTIVAGVTSSLGISVTHALPYNPRAKPIERAFCTLCSRFSKWIDSYCGNSPANRPEDVQLRLARGAAPTLAEFTERFSLWLEGDYHANPHHGNAMDGRTPAEVFDAHLEVKRVIPAAVREIILWKPGPVTRVGRNGVRFGGESYGRQSHELFNWTGKDVIVRVDPADASRVAVCEPSGRFICMAACNRRIPFKATQEEIRSVNAEVKRRNKLVKTYRDAGPKLHRDTAAELYHQRAEQRAREQEQNPPASPTLQPVHTPMNDQMEQLRRALDQERPAAIAVGAEGSSGSWPRKPKIIDLLAESEFLELDQRPRRDVQGSLLRQWMEQTERSEREAREQAESREIEPDPLEQLSRFSDQPKEATDE